MRKNIEKSTILFAPCMACLTSILAVVLASILIDPETIGAGLIIWLSTLVPLSGWILAKWWWAAKYAPHWCFGVVSAVFLVFWLLCAAYAKANSIEAEVVIEIVKYSMTVNAIACVAAFMTLALIDRTV
ncbi:hypothetical protein Mal52_24780 [Symmachiella dynata]|uniref:Transmembrane protein n=1 Tax=Symmachiella dynata TaxID=2527995 RepID=A0A517ZNG8_9PLAN|nr:hypothetical protein [Symmachiella dynata]QDU44000.1 hypothetical protein Mal52_24780 [Symmachiella dynata]